uniref:Protein quiver n=1 Tax=Panagrellus redivivus TaxID=6233 RepID=A0A7E4UXP5_PANRE
MFSYTGWCHLCNQVLTQYAPVSNITQKCTWTTNLPEQDVLIYPDCDGEWCYTFISAPVGGKASVQKGCEARSLLKHQQTKAMDQEFNNASSWAFSEPLWNAPRCSEIVAAADYAIGKNATEIGDMEGQTTNVCLDMEFMQKGLPSKGKLCCCRGNGTCNGDIGWKEEAITVAILDAYRRDHGGIMSNSGSTISLISGFIALTFSLV